MVRFILRRIIALVPVFIGITLISFFVIHLAPGKPTDISAGMDPRVSYEAREKLDRIYGLDKPIYEQYLNWAGRFITMDFGRSYIDDRPVAMKIFERIPVTLLINISAMLLVLGIGIPLGIVSAVRRNSAVDRLSTIFVFAAFSAPEFWVALLAMSLFCITLGWLPVSGIKGLDFDSLSFIGKVADVARHIILPVAIAAIGSIAGISRYMRSSVIGIMGSDFIKAARARGLKEHDVILRHAVKNAMLPVITVLGLSVPGLIGGSVILESIFAIPGMGRLFYESVMARDYPVIMGILSIGAILTLIGNLSADIAYSVADPRIRAEGAREG
jgi:peptide/nickel transport system permease protein